MVKGCDEVNGRSHIRDFMITEYYNDVIKVNNSKKTNGKLVLKL